VAAQYKNRQWIPFQNLSGEKIPPYSCAKVTGSHYNKGLYSLEVTKPDGDTSPPHVITGALEVEDTDYGECTRDIALAALSVESSSGDMVGPVDNEWKLSDLESTFQVIGNVANGKVYVTPVFLNGLSIATLQEKLEAGSTAEAIITKGLGTDPDNTVTVKDALLKSGQTIASGITVFISKIEGVWYVVSAQCS